MAPWVAPYIGDLVGYRTLHGVVPQLASPRADVANTIRYRRRKGTVSVLEQLARDVTGWPAHAVEFFQLLAATQFMNHIRPQAQATANLRDAAHLELAGTFQAGAFDAFAHTAEMRRISTRSGRYNIPNVGIFLWRVQSLRLVRVPLVDADGAGPPLPLRRARHRQAAVRGRGPLADPLRPLRRDTKAHLAARYGTGLALLLETETAAGVDPIAAADVRICNLSDDPAAPGTWAHQPQPGDTFVAVDPVLGRVAFAAAPAAGETRLATFHYGSALAAGGGGYDRSRTLQKLDTVVQVSRRGSARPAAQHRQGGGAVEILDSRTYAGARDDRRDERRGRRSARRTDRGRCSRATTSSSSRWTRTPPSSSTAWCSPAARS